MLDQHRRGELLRLSPLEDGAGDVWSEVGEAENLAEVGSVQLLAFGQIGKLASSTVKQLFVEPVGFAIRLGSGFGADANGSVWSNIIRISLPARRSRIGQERGRVNS